MDVYDLLPPALCVGAASLVYTTISLVRLESLGPLVPVDASRPRHVRPIAALLILLACWLSLYAVELGIPGAEATIRTRSAIYAIVAMVGPTVLFAALQVAEVRTFSRLGAASLALFALPTVSAVLALTSGFQGWFWSSPGVVEMGSLTPAAVEHGPWFQVHTLYSYACVFIAYTIFLHGYVQIGTSRGWDITVLTVAFASPTLLNLAQQVGTPLSGPLDLTAIGLSATALGLAYLLRRDWLREVLPLAWERAVQEFDDAVLVIADDGRVIDANLAGRRLVEQGDGGAFPVAPLRRMVGSEPRRELLRMPWGTALYDVRSTRIELPMGREGRVVSVRDMSELWEASETIRQMTVQDPVTGVGNRRRFDDALASSTSGGAPGGLVLSVQVERFASLADSIGRAASDAVEREVARRLSALAGRPDAAGRRAPPVLLCRLESGEFAAIVEGTLDLHAVEHLASGFADAAMDPIRTAGEEVFVGIRVGAASFERGHAPDAILRAARDARRRARDELRGWAHVEPSELRPDEIHESEIRRGLEHGEFRMHYQPIFEAGSGRPVAVEALIRWQRPHGLVTAGSFIGIAEETGVIVALSRWALEACLTQIEKWNGAEVSPIRVSMNVSPEALRTKEFIRDLRRAAEKRRYLPGQLELELTEHVAIRDARETAEILERFRALDVTIALDDFGTGYSSLSCLAELPLDRLKVDRAFVSRIGEPTNDRLIRAIVELGRALGLEIVAEGVEEAAQLRFLEGVGCDELQGFLLGRPAPANEVEARLEESADWEPNDASG